MKKGCVVSDANFFVLFADCGGVVLPWQQQDEKGVDFEVMPIVWVLFADCGGVVLSWQQQDEEGVDFEVMPIFVCWFCSQIVAAALPWQPQEKKGIDFEVMPIFFGLVRRLWRGRRCCQGEKGMRCE